MKTLAIAVVLVLVTAGQAYSQTLTNTNVSIVRDDPQTDHYTFKLSDKVTRQKVVFKNRYGITLSGDLYQPKDSSNKTLAALAISGPFGAVKEQSSGLYASQMAERGFIALAFDPS